MKEKTQHKEKIAVIGMSGLLPGSETLDQFWDNLIQNKSLVSATRAEDFGAPPELFYDEEKGKLDHCNSIRGGYIRDFQFDPRGYRLPEDLLDQQDVQFKWSLFVAKEALKDAGYWDPQEIHKRCGIILGNLSFPTRYSRHLFSPTYAAIAEEVFSEITGEQLSIPSSNSRYPADFNNTLLTNAPAAFVAQAIGCNGPHFSLDAACASSLYAVKLACDELHLGKADMMLAGAVSGADPLFIHMGFSYFHAYARQHEKSAPLDSDSRGLTSAEGAGMVVLKRLSDAERDGDQIVAVIDAVGLSNDGKGKFLLSPNPKGQKLAFEKAYHATDIRPDDIDYLECHATGTPLGDNTEINSIADFFTGDGKLAPKIGSAKSNFGHLLTAAGMAGMLKVILAMKHKMIPASINIDAPLKSESGAISKSEMVRSNEKWAKKGKVAHAGINAFGFGGTNAHLVLSEYQPSEKSNPTTPPTKNQSLAITGMAIHFGACENLESLYLSLFQGKQFFSPLPKRRWKGMEQLDDQGQIWKDLTGAWLEKFDLDLLRFKIQPKEAERLTLQQTLMLKVAYEALKDSRMDQLEGKGANVAVITAMESELEIHHRMGRWDLSWQVNQALQDAGLDIANGRKKELVKVLKDAVFPAFEDHSPSEHTGFIGNIISSRISALMDFTGPAFTISSNENAVFKGLEVAKNLLANKEVDAVVLGAVDLTGSLESISSRNILNPRSKGQPSLSWNDKTQGWLPGEGAGAIVLKRSEEMTDSDRVYAHVDDMVIVQSSMTDLRGKVGAETVRQAANTVMERQGVSPSAIGLLEVSGSGVASEDKAEILGLTKVYQKENTGLTCAVGSCKTHIGHTFSASGMAALIKNALCIYYRFIPGIPHWEKPKEIEEVQQSSFYFPSHTRPWIPDSHQNELRAAINSVASDGTCVHLLMSEADHPSAKEAGVYLRKGGCRFFPIKVKSLNHFEQQSQEILTSLEEKSFWAVADQVVEKYDQKQEGKTIVLIADDLQSLTKEIKLFSKILPKYWNGSQDLQTPQGSCFTPTPIGDDAKKVVVYPGSGSAYPFLGLGLFQAFPGLYDSIEAKVPELSNAFFQKELYPRSIYTLSNETLQVLEKEMQTKALPMMAIGCTFSAAFTELVQDYLSIKSDSAIGFSMGATSSMWYSQGLWNPKYTVEKFIEAPLFKEKVGGSLQLLAEIWNVSPEEARNSWSSVLLKIPNGIAGYATLKDWFTQVVKPHEKKVFLTFIHTDNEVILSGDKVALDNCLSSHGLQGVSLKINNIVHHAFCRKLETEFLEMHTLEKEKEADKTYYSGITGRPLKLDQQTLAQHATDVCCQAVDWPFLVNQLNEDQHKVYIELGARAFCSRWVDDVLLDTPHLSVATDRKGTSVIKNICLLVARLLAHEVSVDLSHFYAPSIQGERRKRMLKKVLKTGGLPYKTYIREQKEKHHFEIIKKEQPIPVLAGDWEVEPKPVSAFTDQLQPTMEKSSTMNFVNQSIPKVVPTSTEQGERAENGLLIQDYEAPDYLKNKTVIWDEQDLLNFAQGKIADVFGPEFSIIDTYEKRVMLPMPPYLLVSRVTKLNATPNEYKPSTITTEYDIPKGSAFTTDGQIPWAVAVESGQCDLLLISYLGIDFQNKGKYMYRLLDCTLTFLDDLPYEGQTLRYDISINNFVRNGNNLLFFFSYRCYVEDRMVLKMDGGCAGFFSADELAKGQGVVYKEEYLENKKNRKKSYFPPLLDCDKTTFSQSELLALTEGDLVTCFGNHYHAAGRNPSLRLPPKAILMLDRITKVERQGGSAGLGFIEAEKDLLPDDWYFPCHFRDDEVLAGSLQAEGGGQLLRFFMLYLGMQRLTKDARFQPVLDVPQKVICRKEVPAKKAKLIYRMDVKEIGLTPEPFVIADLEIIYDGYVAVLFENLGLRLQEKSNPSYLKNKENLVEGIYVKPTTPPALLNEYHITQFALGPVHKCFGEEYKVFEGRNLSRQPNTDLQFISRVLSVKGKRHTFNDKPEILAEYDVPHDAWYYQQNASPVMPYSVLMEVALQPCGFLGAFLGSTLGAKEKDLFFRNLDGDGTMHHDIDLRGKTVTNKCILVSHTNLAGTVLQRYTFELSVDGKVFYTGNSSFGFFTKEDLSSQNGLDQGKHVKPWIEAGENHKIGSLSFKLDSLFGKMKLFKSINPDSPRLHLAGDQLKLIDTATVIKDGGKYSKGYVFATKIVQPFEWFFTCHFYQDPVMPGSLGVEAIFQAIQLFAVQQELGEGLKNVGFHHQSNHTMVWKYRGQILRPDHEMNLEVHLKEIQKENNQVIILADASLWKGSLRIYEVTDLAVVIK